MHATTNQKGHFFMSDQPVNNDEVKETTPAEGEATSTEETTTTEEKQ